MWIICKLETNNSETNYKTK